MRRVPDDLEMVQCRNCGWRTDLYEAMKQYGLGEAASAARGKVGEGKPLTRRRGIRPKPSPHNWPGMRAYCFEMGRCEYPGCPVAWPMTDPHHVVKRSRGGGDETRGPDRNIANLCNSGGFLAHEPVRGAGSHHRLADLGDLVVEKSTYFDSVDVGGWAFRWRVS